jgi:hypothetical protein
VLLFSFGVGVVLLCLLFEVCEVVCREGAPVVESGASQLCVKLFVVVPLRKAHSFSFAFCQHQRCVRIVCAVPVVHDVFVCEVAKVFVGEASLAGVVLAPAVAVSFAGIDVSFE